MFFISSEILFFIVFILSWVSSTISTSGFSNSGPSREPRILTVRVPLAFEVASLWQLSIWILFLYARPTCSLPTQHLNHLLNRYLERASYVPGSALGTGLINSKQKWHESLRTQSLHTALSLIQTGSGPMFCPVHPGLMAQPPIHDPDLSTPRWMLVLISHSFDSRLFCK